MSANKVDESDQEDTSFQKLLNQHTIALLNQDLTIAMANQRHHLLIKGDRLQILVKRVVSLVLTNPDESKLMAAAVLGRVAAVARNRDESVFLSISKILTTEPPPIDSLSDGEEKFYAASTIKHAKGDWIGSYCYRESISTDVAEKARKELLVTCIESSENAAYFFNKISENSHLLQAVLNQDSRIRKVRRILTSIKEVIDSWKGTLGDEIGESLAECFKNLVKGEIDKVEEDTMFGMVDQTILILMRIVELRFSYALQANTYQVVENGKRKLGTRLWNKFLTNSEVIQDLRVCLLEAALVLARQNKTDKNLLDILLTAYSSKEQVSSAINRHFNHVKDLEPDIREWWLKAGSIVTSQREAEHRVGNSEDQQIGTLLIEVETSKEAMEKLRRAVVPILEISDPVLAATVDKAAAGYGEIAQIARRLARMRRLTKSNLSGQIMEYNPLEHELIGGYRPGIRKIKIVRDAIQKDFAGKIKTLVKARVEEEQ